MVGGSNLPLEYRVLAGFDHRPETTLSSAATTARGTQEGKQSGFTISIAGGGELVRELPAL